MEELGLPFIAVTALKASRGILARPMKHS